MPPAWSMSLRNHPCMSFSSSFPAKSRMQSGLQNDDGVTGVPLHLSRRTNLEGFQAAGSVPVANHAL